MDFTLAKYTELLQSLIDAKYNFQTFEAFLIKPNSRSVILRHDVDLLPNNSLEFARIQAQAGIQGVYYFRAVPESWDEDVMLKIRELGHEIGYHYECLTTTQGNFENGIRDFENNLAALRKIVPVHTICMHGSPMSKYDSKDLWKTYNYRDYNLIGEPYFDIDFKKVLYLTDTGRKWNGNKFSVRDRVNSGFQLNFQNTDSIIQAVHANELPHQIMFNFHPQRWTNDKLQWVKELVFQNTKNVVKQMLYVNR